MQSSVGVISQRMDIITIIISILVGGLEHVLFFHILGMSSSQLTKSIIFQRGRSTTNQIIIIIKIIWFVFLICDYYHCYNCYYYCCYCYYCYHVYVHIYILSVTVTRSLRGTHNNDNHDDDNTN
jgi:hypothetical protein